jgi:hypothetical protein
LWANSRFHTRDRRACRSGRSTARPAEELEEELDEHSLYAGTGLERCRSDLLDPARGAEPGHRGGRPLGFVDPAHFSRLNRAAYGAPPARYRDETVPPRC